jgi:chromosome segregation ATPase
MTQTHVKITTTRIFSGQTLTFQVKINNNETEAIQRLDNCNNVEIRDVTESSIGRITTSGTIHIDSKMRERIQLSISQREIDYIRQDPNYEHEIEYQHQMSDQRRVICIWKQTKDQTKTKGANITSTTDLKINEMITQLRQDLNIINDTLTKINDDLNNIRGHENSIDEKMKEIEQQTMIANNQIPEIMQAMKENVKLIQSGTDTIETQTNKIQQNLITSLTRLETKLTAEITAHLALTKLEQNQCLYSDIIISANIGDCHNELTALTSAGAPSSRLEQWDDTSFELIH